MASCLVFRLPHSAPPQPVVDSRQSSSGNLVRAVTPLPSAHRPSAHSLACLSSAPGTLTHSAAAFLSPSSTLDMCPLLGLCAFPQPEVLPPQKLQLPQALLTFHLLWPHNLQHGAPTLSRPAFLHPPQQICCFLINVFSLSPSQKKVSSLRADFILFCSLRCQLGWVPGAQGAFRKYPLTFHLFP